MKLSWKIFFIGELFALYIIIRKVCVSWWIWKACFFVVFYFFYVVEIRLQSLSFMCLRWWEVFFYFCWLNVLFFYYGNSFFLTFLKRMMLDFMWLIFMFISWYKILIVMLLICLILIFLCIEKSFFSIVSIIINRYHLDKVISKNS